MTSRLQNLNKRIHQHRALLMLAFAAFLAELAYAVLNLSGMPPYVRGELDCFSKWGLILGTFLGAEALSRPALGALGDRIGRKPLMLAGPAITAVTAYASILYTGPYVVPYLMALRALDGLGSSALWMNAFAAVGDVVSEKHRSTAMSVLNVTYMGGMALGFLLGGGVNDYFGTLRASFYLASGLFALAFLALLIFFPRTKKPHHVDIPGHEVAPDFKLSHVLRSFREVPDMIVMAMVTFIGMGMLTPIVKDYATHHLGMTETAFGLAIAPIAAAMGLFAVPMGRLGDKYGKTTAVCWGLFASAAAMWILALYKVPWVIALAGVVIGLGFTVAFPAWNALVISSTDPRRRGEVLGAVGLAQGVAAWAGTLLGPIIYESDAISFPRLGIVNYNLPFWISAIAITAGAVICFTWVCKKRVHDLTDEHITERQRRLVVTGMVIGLVTLCGWVGYRYTLPIPADRVAWCWVQQLARNKPEKAIKFSLIRGEEGWNGNEVAAAKAKEYHYLTHTRKASYVVRVPQYASDRRKAEVRIKFNIPGSPPKFQMVTLCREDIWHEWRVCGVRPCGSSPIRK